MISSRTGPIRKIVAAEESAGMDRELVLGVDFGTSHTSAGVYLDGRVQLVVDGGDPMIPSVVHLPDHGAAEVGRRAVPFLLSDPNATVASVKRLMGNGADEPTLRRLSPTVPYRLSGAPSGALLLRIRTQDYAVEQVAGYILERIRNLAEQRFGGSVRRVICTVSATASERYQTALRMAARLANLDVVGIIAEPIAGALALGMHARPDHRRMAVVDFGGGTFDVTLIEQRKLRFDVIATGGDEFLGGDDLDQALVQGVAGHIFRGARFDLLRDATRRQMLTVRCESIKRALSSAPQARLHMRDAFVENGVARDLDLVIDREWVKPLWDPLFLRALDTLDQTMARGGWGPGHLDELALIGGTTLIPRFQQMVRERYPKVNVTISDLAGVAVAIGATLLTGRASDGDVPVLSSGSLSVESAACAN